MSARFGDLTNVVVKQDGNRCVMIVDTSVPGIKSQSGETYIIAGTFGVHTLPNGDMIKVQYLRPVFRKGSEEWLANKKAAAIALIEKRYASK